MAPMRRSVRPQVTRRLVPFRATIPPSRSIPFSPDPGNRPAIGGSSHGAGYARVHALRSPPLSIQGLGDSAAISDWRSEMNIKSLLLGSVAAMAAVSGAQAADAIVAAEPEPVEYVKVCDAFGKGYFYIPGTETCLKLSGYVRTQLNSRMTATASTARATTTQRRRRPSTSRPSPTPNSAHSPATSTSAAGHRGRYSRRRLDQRRRLRRRLLLQLVG